MGSKLKLEDIKSIELTKDYFDYYVRWDVNHICNLNCWFCSQGTANQHTFTQEDIDYYNNNAKEIVKQLNSELTEIHNKKIMLNILGGEPTLTDLPNIIDSIEPGDNSILFKITTNFTAPQEYLDRLLKVTEGKENKILKFTVSVHESEVDFDTILEKIKQNYALVKSVVIVVYDWETYNDYLQLRKELDCKVTPQLCFDNIHSIITCPEEIIQKIDFKDKQGKFRVVDKDGNESFWQRYELLYELGGMEIPSFQGMNCTSYTKILADNKVRICRRDLPKEGLKILQNQTHKCNTCKACNLCYPIRLER